MCEALCLARVPRSSSRLDRMPVDAGWWAPHATLKYGDERRMYDLFDEAMCCLDAQRLFAVLEEECERRGAVVGTMIGLSFDVVKTDDPIPALDDEAYQFDDPARNEACAGRLRSQLPRAFRRRHWQEGLASRLWTIEDVISLLEDAVRLVPVATGECA